MTIYMLLIQQHDDVKKIIIESDLSIKQVLLDYTSKSIINEQAIDDAQEWIDEYERCMTYSKNTEIITVNVDGYVDMIVKL